MKIVPKNKSIKILVTGGAGFIGSALVRHIISNTEHTVLNIDKLTYASNTKSLTNISNNKRYYFKKVDICDSIKLREILSDYKPEIVMHLAAESHVDRSINSPNNFIKTNILGTYTLLEQLRIYWSKLNWEKKNKFCFHHISTDEVYGDLLNPIDKKSTKNFFTENTPYAPSSPYSASKASSDHLVRAWYRTYGLPILISNCSNNYGPYHYPDKLIPLTISNALNGKPIPIYGKGDQIRDWLYVEDHVRALLLVATKGRIGETYNIGGNNEKQNVDVVKTICRILEKIVPIKESKLNISNYENLIFFINDRPGHDKRYAIDASKIKNELGWKPLETFDSGISKTIQWYVDNPLWCQKIQNS